MRKGNIIKGIKDILKSDFKIDLAIIQSGCYFEIIEEDAKYFHDNFNFKIHNCGGFRRYPVTGFPVSRYFLKKYLNILNERKIMYAIVHQINVGKDKVTREVTYSPNKEALGLIF